MKDYNKKDYKEYKGKVISNDLIAKDCCKMLIKSDLESASAGQFVSMLCPFKTLRRPFSIAGFDNNIIKILYKVKGEATGYFKTLKANDEVDFLAPMGRGFNIENKNSLLIGAGIGIAPMLFLKEEMNKKNIKNYLISGFRADDEIIKGSDETKIGGSVLDNIENIIKERKIEKIYSCGPNIVLQKLCEITNKMNIETEISLEKVMACSIGVCRGCVINLLKNNEKINASVCKDGPVFSGSEVLWN